MATLKEAKAKLRSLHQKKSLAEAKASLRQHKLNLEKIDLKRELKAVSVLFLGLR